MAQAGVRTLGHARSGVPRPSTGPGTTRYGALYPPLIDGIDGGSDCRGELLSAAGQGEPKPGLPRWHVRTRFGGDRSRSRAARARDRNSGNNQTLYIAYPAVDQASGVVYDSWHDYARNRIYVDKSSNGGASWGTDVVAATTHTGFGTDIGCVGGRSQGPAHALKVGPRGALYLVYADKVTGRGYNILLTKSTNGGATWSAPVTLNDDSTANDQFHPTLSVASNGAGGDTVTVSFYDRRDDPADCLVHVYGVQSTDSGATWSANVRLSGAPSNFDGNPNGPGDYSSGAPFAASVTAFHSDHRTADFEVYAYRGQ